jgi:hypothetical protein
MSKKVFVTSVQPDPEGPIFGRVMDPVAIQKLQDYSHGHIDQIVKDLLMAGAPTAEVAGLAATVAGGLNVSVAVGSIVDGNGISYQTPDDATVVAMAAAHVSLPRIDLIYATLEVDASAETELVSFRQLRTQAELEADVDPYVPTQFSQPTELHTRATIGVKTGVANASPVAPAVGAGEVALWRVHLSAGQTVLVGGDLTSVRVMMKSLYSVIQDVLALQGQMAGLTESVQDIVGAFLANGDGSLTLAYNDGANTFSLVLAAGYKALLDGATPNSTANTLVKRDVNGHFNAGSLRLNVNSPPVGGIDQYGVIASGTSAAEQVVFTLCNGGAQVSAKFTSQRDAPQNSPIIRFYNQRGGNPGSDKLRWMNDQFGRTFCYGEVRIQLDVDGLGGSLDVAGAFTAGSKSFEIDHPVDPLNKNLRFATTESPGHGIECWGQTTLVAGAKVIDLDAAMGCSAGTFAALFENPRVYLQNANGYSALKYTLVDGSLTINCENGSSTDTVNWEIKGVRKDELIKVLSVSDEDGHLIVEYDKPAYEDPGPETRITRAEVAVPDEEIEVIDVDRLGTVGFPRHAALAPDLGPVPTRSVTIETHDLDDNPYEP